MIGDVWNDARIAVRTLLRRPGTSLVIVLTLGIGLAASTTVFTVFDLLVLGPLPFDQPDRLVRLRQTRELPGQGVRASSVTGRNFTAWRERTTVLRDMAAARFRTLSLTGEGEGEPERVVGIEATWTHFSVLGVEPLLGRTFGPDEDAAGAPAPVAVLSHSLWTRRYGRDPSVLGEEIVVAGRAYTVVGVMPEGFRYPYSAEVWLPLGLSPDAEEWERGILNVSARMVEGATLEGVRAELDAVASSLAAERPDTNQGSGIRVIPIREEVLEGMDQKVRALLWAALFVLLIATANVASMVLARAQRRQDELSVRVALGASRLDLVRPVLVEGLLLSIAGAALGIAVASWAGPPLAAMSPMDDVADFFRDVAVTGRVAAFGMAAAALVAVLSTLPVAARAIRHRPGGAVSRSRGGAGGEGRVLDGLIVTEVAVAVVLLTGAGLMVQSLRNLRATDLGVDVDGLAVFAVSPSTGGYAEPGGRMLLMDEIVERVRRLQTVGDAAVTNFNPLRDQGWGAAVWPLDRAPSPEQSSVTVNHRAVTPGFFRTAGIELLAGRGFRPSDDPGSPDVAVVAESLAERLWPGEDPVGRRLRAGAADELDAPVVTVVGVAEDVADFGEIEGTWYRPLRQDPSEFPTASLEIFVRSSAASGGPAAFESLVAGVRSAVGDVDSSLPVFDVQRARSIVRFERRMETFTTLLLGAFACVGLVLAAVGVYGVLSYAVGRRTREIGIRQALGASPAQVVGLVLRGALAVTGLGIVLGVGAAALLTRFLESFLVGISPLDPHIFAFVAAGCLAVALMAAWVPARRATTVEPRSALAEP
ncbi:MAG: ABC transporter permease [Gemmatimonadota bacterium]|jgi:predicted permease